MQNSFGEIPKRVTKQNEKLHQEKVKILYKTEMCKNF